MADTLQISNLVAPCRIGVTAEERAMPQSLWIDLTISINAKVAASEDDVRYAIDYAKLVSAVQARVQRKPVQPRTVAGDLELISRIPHQRDAEEVGGFSSDSHWKDEGGRTKDELKTTA